MIQGLIATLISVPTSYACGEAGAKSGELCAEHAVAAVQTPADPARRTHRAELMGAGNCSWSTSGMARRVLAEGAPYTYVGLLQESENQLQSKVAAPYTIGPEGRIHVIANEVLDSLANTQATSVRMEFAGKLLTVEGVEYLVVEKVVAASS